MTLKDKLPDRLKCSPLLTMESDSDIETIAESIVSLSNSDGDFFKKTEKLLLMACLGYLRDWCEPSQRTIGNLISLLDAALPKDNETHTTLDNLFYEMKSGCKRVKSEDGITTLWEPSALSRCDGLTPRDSNGIDVSEDFSLTPSSVNCMMPLPAMPSRLTVRLSLPRRPSRLRTPQVPSRLTTLSIPTTSRGRPSWSMRRLPMQRVRSSPSIGTNPTFPSR